MDEGIVRYISKLDLWPEFWYVNEQYICSVYHILCIVYQVYHNMRGNRCGNWGQWGSGGLCEGRLRGEELVGGLLITKCTHDNPICWVATQPGGEVYIGITLLLLRPYDIITSL